MTIKEKDFVEIEFTGKIKDSQEIFDSNIQEDIKKAKLDIKEIKTIYLVCRTKNVTKWI
jgi:FKBP-type peptidyl-prolyl cis-trans isomerase 2